MKRFRFFAALALALALAFSFAQAETARRLPVAFNVSTFGGPSRNFTTLQAWEDATDYDLVAAGLGEVLDCYPDSASYDQLVNVSGANADTSYFRVIRAAPGYERQVVFDYTGTIGVYGGVVNVVSEKSVGLYDLCIRHHGNEATITKDLFFNANSVLARVVGCVIGPSANQNSAGVAGAQTYNGGKAVFVNTVFRGDTMTTSLVGIGAGTAGGTVAYNCIIYRYGTSWSGTAAGVIKNCILATKFTNFFGTAPSQTTCIVGNETVVGFVAPASGNFHLPATSTNAIDTGTDLSADAVFGFTDDVDGDARPLGNGWEIGIDEYRPPTSGRLVWTVN